MATPARTGGWWLTISAYLLFLVALAGWQLSARSTPLLTGLLLAPWLLAGPGLWRGHRYTFACCSLLVCLYLVYALTEAIANPPVRIAASLALFAAFGLFIGIIAFQRQARAAPPAPE